MPPDPVEVEHLVCLAGARLGNAFAHGSKVRIVPAVVGHGDREHGIAHGQSFDLSGWRMGQEREGI